MNGFHNLLSRTIGLVGAFLILSVGMLQAQWVPVQNVPVASGADYSNFASAVYNGKAYTFGGISAGALHAPSYSFDMTTETWTTGPSMTSPLMNSTAVTLGKKIFIFGGQDAPSWSATSIKNTLVSYDPATKTFTNEAQMPRPITSATAVVVDGRAYIMGGVSWGTTSQGSGALFQSVIYIYDPANGWDSVSTTVPYNVYNAQSTSTTGKIYLAGGNAAQQGTGYALFLEGSVIRPDSISWRQLQDLPGVVISGSMSMHDGQPFIYAGAASFDPTDTYLYDAASNAWGKFHKIPSQRQFGDLVTDGKNTYLIAGTGTAQTLKLTDEVRNPSASATPTTITIPARPDMTIDLSVDVSNSGLAPLEAELSFPNDAWVTGSTANVAVNQSKELRIVVNTAGKTAGQYTVNGTIATNDPENASIPVTINVFVSNDVELKKNVVVLEEAHGTWCPPCGEYGIPAVEDIEAKHGDNVVVLSHHHAGGGLPSRFDPFATTNSEALSGRLGLNAFPTGSVQRIIWNGQQNQQLSAGVWESAIDAVLNSNPYATSIVDVKSYQYDPDTRRVNAVVTVSMALPVSLPTGTTLNLTAMVNEDELMYSQAYVTKAAAVIAHENVVRQYYPDVDGQPITIPAESMSSNTVMQGTMLEIPVSFTVDELTVPSSTGAGYPQSIDITPDHSNILFLVTLNQGTALGPVIGVYEAPLTENVGEVGGPAISVNFENPAVVNVPAMSSKTFTIDVTNNNDEPTQVTVTRVKNTMPNGWYSEICTGPSECDDINSVVYTIPANGTHQFSLNVYGGSEEATGVVTLQVSAGNVSQEQNFAVNTGAASVGYSAEAGGLAIAEVTPNPVSTTARVDVLLPAPSETSLEVFNVKGQKIATLFNGRLESGANQIDADVSGLASGTYVLVLKSGEKTVTTTLTVVR